MSAHTKRKPLSFRLADYAESKRAEDILSVFHPREVKVFMEESFRLFGVPTKVLKVFLGNTVIHFIQIWIVLTAFCYEPRFGLTCASAMDFKVLFSPNLNNERQWESSVTFLHDIELLARAHPCYPKSPCQSVTRFIPNLLRIESQRYITWMQKFAVMLHNYWETATAQPNYVMNVQAIVRENLYSIANYELRQKRKVNELLETEQADKTGSLIPERETQLNLSDPIPSFFNDDDMKIWHPIPDSTDTDWPNEPKSPPSFSLSSLD